MISLECVILVRCDALGKESEMPADDTIPACAIAFVHPDPSKKISVHSPHYHFKVNIAINLSLPFVSGQNLAIILSFPSISGQFPRINLMSI